MIIDCDASVSAPDARPRFARARVVLSQQDGQSYVFVVSNRKREQFAVRNVSRLHPATIAFREPNVLLMLRHADQPILQNWMKSLQQLIRGVSLVDQLPAQQKLLDCKPPPPSSLFVQGELSKRQLENRSLVRVHVQDLRIPLLPYALFQLPLLTELRLVNCGLSQLPKHLCALGRTLKLLDLSSNRLSALSVTFCRSFTHLTSLNISQNAITSLPLELASCRELSELNVSRNRLRTIPITLKRLTKLRLLNLAGNHMEVMSAAITESLARLRSMQHLDVSDNHKPKQAQDYKLLLSTNGSTIQANPQMPAHRLRIVNPAVPAQLAAFGLLLPTMRRDRVQPTKLVSKSNSSRRGKQFDFRTAHNLPFPSLLELSSSAILLSYKCIQALNEHLIPQYLADQIDLMTNLCSHCRMPFVGYRTVECIQNLSTIDFRYTIVSDQLNPIRVARYLCPLCALNSCTAA